LSTPSLYPGHGSSSRSFFAAVFELYKSSLTVDDEGSFLIIKGKDTDKPEIKKELDEHATPVGLMTIDHIIVPPYPSIPAIPDSTFLSFLNKRVGNATGIINIRIENHLIHANS
jgi:hypothetical protein